MSREVCLGLRALAKTQSLVDLDKQLHGNDTIRQELADETKALLRQANYGDDILGGYEAWSSDEAAKSAGAQSAN
jgi:hypothetical protein